MTASLRNAIVLGFALIWPAGLAAQEPAHASPDTRVILLGTGNPNPEPERMGPAVAVVSADRVYLVDCGPGVVRRAAQAGLRMAQLTRAFVTHLHSDHTAGYPDLIFTPAVTGRLEPFAAYGPPGLRAMTGHILKAWRQDMEIRLHGLEPSVPRAYVVQAHDVKPGEIYRDEGMRVIAFAVKHGTWKYAYGYRFEAPDKVIVVSGDTTYSENLVQAAKGCDILVHEVYSQKGLARRTADWQRYHTAFHTSGPDVGRVGAQVRPRKLVLYHQLPMGETPGEILQEVHQQFDGETIYGNDLEVVR
ncbi:MAG TPA: MBL fold metallo-hydrolase [Bryobacteraceae bacterium]|nr:MBL fold metallo-hydrolase [Bryobacteraceae bacterium]